MADLSKIVDELSSLTVLEAAELSKMLEEKWGVSAAAAVAVAAGPAAAAAPVEEKTEFTVVLAAAGDKHGAAARVPPPPRPEGRGREGEGAARKGWREGRAEISGSLFRRRPRASEARPGVPRSRLAPLRSSRSFA